MPCFILLNIEENIFRQEVKKIYLSTDVFGIFFIVMLCNCDIYIEPSRAGYNLDLTFHL